MQCCVNVHAALLLRDSIGTAFRCNARQVYYDGSLTYNTAAILYFKGLHVVFLNNVFLSLQGRRRVFKSGPAEEDIECRRHERGRAREGDYSPSRKGGLGGLPRENF